ncbi:MAG: hypothetical protein H7Y15_14480 [Pseudonocardia sp.]|nr:hypothetical protein [Pseudonocardia sp.]
MYELRSSDHVDDQVTHLPREVLVGFAEVRAVLEVAPWSGESIHDASPHAPVRSWAFGPDGRGVVYYLIQERLRLVDLLDVLWTG